MEAQDRIKELEDKLQKATQANITLIVERQKALDRCEQFRRELDEAEAIALITQQQLEAVQSSMDERLKRALASQTKFRQQLAVYFNDRFRQLQQRHESESAEAQLKLMELRAQIEAMLDEQDEYVRQIQELGARHSRPIENDEIRQYFEIALDEATEELDIFSPWMNLYVVDDELQAQFEQLLSRGVTLKIRYGIGQGDTLNDSRNFYTEQVADILKHRYKRYRHFRMYRDNSHAKLFICDEQFYVISSFNILSYDGGKTRRDIRGELGEYSQYLDNLRKYREHYFDF